MFTSIGLFRNIPCPQSQSCQLLNCIFSHDLVPDKASSSKTNTLPDQTIPNGLTPTHLPEVVLPARVTGRKSNKPSAEMGNVISALTGSGKSDSSTRNSDHGGRDEDVGRKYASIPQTAKRPISPPPTRLSKKVRVSKPPPSGPSHLQSTDKLSPRLINGPSARFEYRVKVLKGLYEKLQKLNEQVNVGSEAMEWELSDGHLKQLAVDIEHDVVVRHQPIYPNMMSRTLLKFSKMDIGAWRLYLEGTISQSTTATTDKTSDEQTSLHVPPGINAVEDEITILKMLQTPLDGVEKFGYVTSAPTPKEIAAAQLAQKTAGGYETCDRCGSRFKVFPGPDESGKLTSGGICAHHWGKPLHPPGKRKGHVDAVYTCCSKQVGSEGCETAETHVFKVNDPKRLASTLQFEPTPHTVNDGFPAAVTFDCEMCYTTLGMELIRLTAITWPDNTNLLDVLVRPQGVILDFNTRFSGISKQMYANALPYGVAAPTHTVNSSADRESDPEPLRVVESPAAARGLFFAHLTQDTPLLGHAIENDLNVCRIIHPFIVDTVLLYPHPRGLPIRYGLKYLADRHLKRSIQTGGDAGHDSKEDAQATGDLVRAAVWKKWTKMKSEGWVFEDGLLIRPQED